jgi:hypothetical protein
MRVYKIAPFFVVILIITVSFAGVAAALSSTTPKKLPATISATAYPTSVTLGKPFKIYGTLNNTAGKGIPGATVWLQVSTNPNPPNFQDWTIVTPSTTTYKSYGSNPQTWPGGYSFTASQQHPPGLQPSGTWYYRTFFAGNASTFNDATVDVSNVVSVNVYP